MSHAADASDTIVRTERGLSFAGTRLTLYAFLDYVHAGWPPEEIQRWLNLTDEQLTGALAYLDAHRSEVEQEYQQVLQRAEENRRYWEARQRQRQANGPPAPATPEHAALRAKLQAWKEKLGQA